MAKVNFESLVPGDFEASCIKPQKLHDRGVDIGDVVGIFVGVKS